MNSFFALFPLLSIYFLFDFLRNRFRVRWIFLTLLTLVSLMLGFLTAQFLVGALYAALFLMMCLSPWGLKRQVKRAVERYRIREKVLKKQVGESKLEREKWTGIRQKMMEETERISKRYAFAHTLVVRTDEKSVLMDLSVIFNSVRKVLGLAFSASLGKGSLEKMDWTPSFTSGWVTEEDWGRLLKNVPIAEDRAETYNLPRESDLAEKMKSDNLHLVYAPVKWGGEIHGLLTLLLEGPIAGEFLEEVFRYAQLLGLGLYKTYLYQIMIERSRKDGLTHLYLRRIFLERLNEEIIFSKRYHTSFSILLLDLDHFKAINDTYGHVMGDRVLSGVAECLKSVLHPGVTLARYGGEEFAILIGLAPADQVKQTAELIRHSIETLVFMIPEDLAQAGNRKSLGKREIQVTVSIGIAHYLPDEAAPNELIHRADTALYLAKDAGRNIVKEWKKNM